MPYQPGVQNRVGDYLFAGITQAGHTLGQGIQNWRDRTDQMEERDKKQAEEAKQMRGIAKIMKNRWGLGDADVEGMDVGTLKGIIEGNILKDSQAGQQLLQERNALALLHAKRSQENQDVFSRAFAMRLGGAPEQMRQVQDPLQMFLPGGSMQDVLPPPAEDANAPWMVNPAMANQPRANPMQQVDGLMGGPRQRPQMSTQEMMQIAASAGVLTPEMALRFGGQDGENGPLSTIFDEDPVTGMRLATRGKTLIPTGINPNKVPAMETIDDPKTGKPMVVKLPNGGGKFTYHFLSPEITGEVKQAILDGKPMPGRVVDATGKLQDQRTALEKESVDPYEDIVHQLRGFKAKGVKKVKQDSEGNLIPNPLFGGVPLDDFLERATEEKDRGESGGKPVASKRAAKGSPAVGTVESGYRFNGKFPPNDERAWTKVGE